MRSKKRINSNKKRYTKKKGGASNNLSSAPAPSPSRRYSKRNRSMSSRPTRVKSLPSRLSSRSRSNSLNSRSKRMISSPGSYNNNIVELVTRKKVSNLHRTLFDAIRDSIKSHAQNPPKIMKYESKDGKIKAKSKPGNVGDAIGESMFLFSYPSALVNDFLYSLYNENLVRINHKQENIIQNKYKTIPKMMISVVELISDPNTIYITTSEEPNSDSLFYDKLADLLTMVKNMIYGVSECTKMRPKDLGNLIEIIDIDDSQQDELDKKLNESRYRKDDSFLKDIPNIYNKADKSTKKQNDNYRTLILGKKVKYIFNNSYIQKRRKGESYEPFYKLDKDEPIFMACNSGSICSESKVFSYLHDNHQFSEIKGAIAYWVGNNNSGEECEGAGLCNYHPKYCYSYSNENKEKVKHSEKEIIETMMKQLISKNLLSKELSDIFKTSGGEINHYVIQPYALPCPGCTLNSSRYVSDTRIKWNPSGCLEHIDKEKLSRAQARQLEEIEKRAVKQE